MTPTAKPAKHKTNVKETLVSIIIAFTLAFVFRGFVVEAFLIPTGSMAPTLLGAHLRNRSAQSGYDYPIEPPQKGSTGDPLPVQGVGKPVPLTDPMTGYEFDARNVPVSWGDRIFVMKYLYSVYDPKRFDVVVFKNPTDPTINYIKRLIGLPGEMVALVDGDVFTRPGAESERNVVNTWELDGWRIARKPERAQREMWQMVYSSEYAPLNPVGSDRREWFTCPWKGVGAGWKIGTERSYRYTGSGPTALEWDWAARPITDAYPYNSSGSLDHGQYPVSDVRVRLGVEGGNGEVAAVLETRGHEFRAEVKRGAVTLRMRSLADANAPWRELGTGSLPDAPGPGGSVNLDFWFVDQSLQVWSEDALVARGEYEWSVEERLQHTLRMSANDVVQQNFRSLLYDGNVAIYPRPRVRIELGGGDVTLHRVCLERDIYYQPGVFHPRHSLVGHPATATHPSNGLFLTGDQFFVCGDNSPQSLDARLWDSPHPWVADIDKTMGVVHRDLMIGKAFFVYFPSPLKKKPIPVPDFGEMRFIW